MLNSETTDSSKVDYGFFESAKPAFTSRSHINERIKQKVAAVFPRKTVRQARTETVTSASQQPKQQRKEVRCQPFLAEPVAPLNPLWTHKVHRPYPTAYDPQAHPDSFAPNQFAALIASYMHQSPAPTRRAQKPLTNAQKKRNAKKLAIFEKKKLAKYGVKKDDAKEGEKEETKEGDETKEDEEKK